jgi:hypothetical protein
MAMNRAQFAKLLQEGLNTVWGLEYKQYPEEWRQLFQIESSKKAFEEDQLVTGFGAAVVKGEGAGITYDEAQQGWTSRYHHETIALAFTITQEAIEDNLYMTMGAKYAKALARSMQHTKEIKGAAVLNNAFNVAFAGGDSKPLLAADHPLVGGGVQSNLLSTPADLAEASLEDLLIQIRKTKDDRGIPIAIKPTDLVIPPELEFTAVRLLESTLRPGLQAGATAALNDVNAINRKSIFGKEPIVITRLTDSDAFFIKTDVNDGLKMFQRVAVTTKMEEEFNSTNWRYRARERYSMGWSDFRSLFGSSGAV